MDQNQCNTDFALSVGWLITSIVVGLLIQLCAFQPCVVGCCAADRSQVLRMSSPRTAPSCRAKTSLPRMRLFLAAPPFPRRSSSDRLRWHRPLSISTLAETSSLTRRSGLRPRATAWTVPTTTSRVLTLVRRCRRCSTLRRQSASRAFRPGIRTVWAPRPPTQQSSPPAQIRSRTKRRPRKARLQTKGHKFKTHSQIL
jgi:hypothetical protein